MLVYVKTNLFESPAQVLVNTVNTVGVMGKGIALQFKKLYPDMFARYQKYCEAGLLTVGKLWLYKSDTKWVLNFPTKRNWRQRSRLSDIEAGLQKFVETYEQHGIQSISFPQLGVGNGGLDWDSEVKPLMEKYLRKLPIDVYIHLYNGKQNPPEYSTIREMRQWLELEPKSLSLQEFETEFAQTVPQTHLDGYQISLSPDALIPAKEQGETFLTVHPDQADAYVLSKDDIADFWMRMRDKGIVSSAEFPSIMIERGDVSLFESLLTALPYIVSQPIVLSGVGTLALGLNKRKLPATDVRHDIDHGQSIVEAG